MKKKKAIIISAIISIILISIFFAIHNSEENLYRRYWNIDFPKIKKIDKIIERLGMDPYYFSILYFNENDINTILKNNNIFKKNDLKLEEIYYDYIYKAVHGRFDKDELNRFYNLFDRSKLFTEENYYAFIPQKDGRNFALFLIETKNNIVYAFKYYS